MAVIARDGTILDANRAASALFAWPHAEFLGRALPHLCHKQTVRQHHEVQVPGLALAAA